MSQSAAKIAGGITLIRSPDVAGDWETATFFGGTVSADPWPAQKEDTSDRSRHPSANQMASLRVSGACFAGTAFAWLMRRSPTQLLEARLTGNGDRGGLKVKCWQVSQPFSTGGNESER